MDISLIERVDVAANLPPISDSHALLRHACLAKQVLEELGLAACARLEVVHGEIRVIQADFLEQDQRFVL